MLGRRCACCVGVLECRCAVSGCKRAVLGCICAVRCKRVVLGCRRAVLGSILLCGGADVLCSVQACCAGVQTCFRSRRGAGGRCPRRELWLAAASRAPAPTPTRRRQHKHRARQDRRSRRAPSSSAWDARSSPPRAPRRGHGEGAGGTAHGALRTGRGVPTRGPQARTRCCWPPALRPPPGEHTAGTGTPFKTACPVSAGLPASRGRLVCSRSRAWGVKRVPPFAAAGPWALTCWEAGRVTGCRLGGGRPCPIPGSTRGGTLGHPAPPSGPGLHLPWSGSRLSPRTCSRNCRPLPAPSPGQALLPPFPCGRSGCALPLSQGHPSRSPCKERAGVSGQEGPQQRMALPGRAAVGGRGA